MKTLSRFGLARRWVLLSVIAWVTSLQAGQLRYTCGMHPRIMREEAGECPICGMKLTLVAALSQGAMLNLDGATIQRMNLRIAEVHNGLAKRELRVPGTVVFSESGRRDVTSKFEGWIERVHVDTSWQAVRTGDPLFEIYSPELYNAELSLLASQRSEGPVAGPLTRAAVERLHFYDMPASAIEELTARRSVSRAYVFPSPANGVVIEKLLTEGQLIKRGDVIYRIADPEKLWIVARIAEDDVPVVHEGAEVALCLHDSTRTELRGAIVQVSPELDPDTRSALVRIAWDNASRVLRPGMFAEVIIPVVAGVPAPLVPAASVIRGGQNDFVYLEQGRGRFELRPVQVGMRTTDSQYEILRGLAAGDRVVEAGQFLLDSEAQLGAAGGIPPVVTSPLP